MATVANPIYDTVFKYLMEDDRIVHRLLSAASDAELRQTMNVEDEYYSAIENRDTAIMLRDEKIAEQSTQLAEKDEQLAEQKNNIISSAKMMKDAGIPESAIAAATGLSVADITAL